jgi:membrane fusion protein (multidrug efflux system)
MRKTALSLVVAIVLLLGAGAGWQWWKVWRFQQSTDDAYVQSDVSVISPKVEGYIKEVRVEENQKVTPGQVLFVIDDSDYAAKVAQAEAAVATEEAAVDTYDSRLELQRATIAQAQAEIVSAQAEEARTQRDYQRYQALTSSAYASRQRFETAEADDRKAIAAVEQKKAAVVAAQHQLGVLRAERDEEKAKRQQARANLTLARNDLGNTVIRAPLAGVAGNRAGRVGQYVKAGTQLLSLVPLPHVYVIANFKETQLTAMRPGQPADVTVDAYPDRRLKGAVESFAPGSGAEFSLLPPDNATGNFTKIVQRVPVRIALPPGGPLAALLRPGLSVTVTVDTHGERSPTAPSRPREPVIGRAETPPQANSNAP